MTNEELLYNLYNKHRPDVKVIKVTYKNDTDNYIEGYEIDFQEPNGMIRAHYLCIESIPSLWVKWREEKLNKLLNG